MAGLKNAFYHKINQVRPSEEPLVHKCAPIGAIIINDRSDIKAIPRGTVKAGILKQLVWDNSDYSIKYITTDTEKVGFINNLFYFINNF